MSVACELVQTLFSTTPKKNGKKGSGYARLIVTQITGAIKYSVSDSVEEKGTTVNRKKPLVHV